MNYEAWQLKRRTLSEKERLEREKLALLAQGTWRPRRKTWQKTQEAR